MAKLSTCRYELCFSGVKKRKSRPLTQMHVSDSEKSQNHHSHPATNGKSNGDDDVMSIPLTQMHDSDSEKSQNHHSHPASNGKSNGNDDVMTDVFRFSRCKKPLPQKMMLTLGIPLPLDHVEVHSNAYIFHLHINNFCTCSKV